MRKTAVCFWRQCGFNPALPETLTSYGGSNAQIMELPPGQGAAMPGRRGGIWLRFDPGVDPEVRRALMQFVRWLQTQYAFTVRVPVYVRAAERLLCRDGDLACGTFLGPSDPEQEPYIRLAVGDYPQLLAAWGQDSALASILRSLAHELTHYFQWVRDPVGYQTADESRLERQADRCARETLYDYADVYAHP